MTENQKLREVLQALLKRYVELVNSGDAGNWDPEAELEVIAARQALALPTDAPKVESERESIAKYFDQYPGREFFGTTVADLIRNKHDNRDCGNCAHVELRSQDEPCRQCIDNYNIFDSEFVHWKAVE